jgi:hypothetical protein
MFPFAPPIMIAFLVNYLFFAKYFYWKNKFLILI